MRIFKKIIAALVCAALAVPSAVTVNSFAEERTMNVTIDGAKAMTTEAMLYRGAGFISANNSSRLLLDYKAENPDTYWEIMNYMFGKDGACMTHFKLEMGADINSSSGTEPNVMRTEDEKADVTRGAGYQLAADAKSINPDLTLDMLYWSEPLWVTNAEDVYDARYKWYKSTLDAAYETYGLKFDYVSAVRNERAADNEWVKYLSKRLKSETGCPYDYSAIKIVAGEEVCTWNAARDMLADEELLNAVDVVGSHYTSWASDDAKRLATEYGKELWFSEGSSSMGYAQGIWRYDGNGSGMSDINGVLDIANRIITMASGGYMTLYEYQPAVAAYYDGVTYCQKQLILANEPWSGYYLLDGGYYMSLHFGQFIKKGWAYVEDACHADGKAGGDGHAIVDATYSYLTATDPDTGDYSTVITNTTPDPITYNFTVTNLDKASSAVNVWETRGPNGGEWNENYFRHIDTVTPTENGGNNTFSVTVKPYSMVTLSTLEVEEKSYPAASSKVLPLPYTDDYGYAEYPADYLSSRGNAPRYTTDEGGAFEVQNIDGNNVLMQMITPETKSTEWGSTPNPVTNFGDDRWFNYSVAADVKLAPSDSPDKNYAGVGLRYNLGSSGESGWWFSLYENGKWVLKFGSNNVAEEGTAEIGSDWNNIKLEADEDIFRCYINGELVAEHTTEWAWQAAGRAALYSSYNQNCFDNFVAAPLDETRTDTYVARFDNTDPCVSYAGDWSHNTMSGYSDYKRTISTGSANAEVTIEFEGTGFAVTGKNTDENVISVEVDGVKVEDSYTAERVGSRKIAYCKHDLEKGQHTAKITVVSGQFSIDGVEITGGDIALLGASAAEPAAAEETAEPAQTQPAQSTPEDVSTPDNADAAPNEEKNGVPIIPIAVGAAAVIAAGAAAAVIISKKKKK